MKSRCEGWRPQRLDFKITKYFRRQESNTAAGQLSTQSCGHVRATVRNVVELDGPAAYICRDCFAYLRAIEVKAIVRDKVAALFRNLRPPAIRLGGKVVDYLLARALLAAYRDRRHQPWIALARLAAQIAERRGST